VEKWVHLGGVLTGKKGDSFVAVGGLRGATSPNVYVLPLGMNYEKHLAHLVSI
jgi:hypothetical protein